MASDAVHSLAAALKRASRSANRKLTVVVGDGIYPLQGFLTPQAICAAFNKKHGRNPTRREEAIQRWKWYEHFRFQTANSCPPFGYFVLLNLIRLGCVRTVITTNYDLYFDSIAEREKPSWVLNPLLKPRQYSWETYYTRRQARPRVWKIHGSLSHATFVECSMSDEAHIFRLPRFRVHNSPITPSVLGRFLPNHEYLPHIGRRFAIPSLGSEVPKRALPSHFLDWAYDNERSAFRREINSALDDLQRQSSAVLTLGFTGFYSTRRRHPWNEELAPILRSLSDTRPVYYGLHDKQHDRLLVSKAPYTYLFTHFRRRDALLPYDDAGDLLSSALEIAGLSTSRDLRTEYNWRWVHGDVFLPRDKLYGAA